MVEQLKMIKDQLITQVQAQMSDLKCVDAKELGEVIDMIKDLTEAVYYCEIYKQMTEAEDTRKMEYDDGRMYYSSPSHSSGAHSPAPMGSTYSGGENNRSYYTERDYPVYLRDEREGRSPMKRKMYMEGKDTGQDRTKSIRELESYMQDLTSDMMELLDKASPEEKSIIQKKVNTLAAKIQNV